jgi:ketosteroid isomerase-like protein
MAYGGVGRRSRTGLAEASQPASSAIRRHLRTVFPDFNSEVLKVRDLGDCLIVAVRVRGHGVEGGAPFEQAVWQAVKLRDGKATWWRNFGSEAEALEAAGLRG